MPDYKHNIVTDRNTEMDVQPETAQYGIQVVVGTAPVNLLDDPASAVNVPIEVTSRADVKKKLGYCTNYRDYTLMQSVLASFQSFTVAPLIFINVLDPSNPRHKAAVAEHEVPVVKNAATIEDQGVILDTLKVTSGELAPVAGTDYIASFDADGNVMLTILPDGNLNGLDKVKVAYSKLDPSGVTATDIIGGVDEHNKRTGIELIDEIYPRMGIVPFILLAPEFSKNAAVAAALEAKAQLNGNIIDAIALCDIDCKDVVDIKNVAEAKDKLGASTRWITLCWPKVKVNGNVISMSAQKGASIQNMIINNNNIPARSDDNLEAKIDATVLDDGTEIYPTLEEANNYLLAHGITTCYRMGTWKFWGNNTAAYPGTKNPNDRFFKCVLFGNYLEDRFKTEYLVYLGNSGSVKLMQSLVNNFNAALNALVPDYMAAASIIFNKDENPEAELMEGRWKFHTHYADWIPVEYIENEFTWNSKLLTDAIYSQMGGEE